MELVDLALRFFEDVVLLLRHDDVADRDRRARKRRVVEAQLLDRVEEVRGLGVAVLAVASVISFLSALVDDVVDERMVPAARGKATLKITRPTVVRISSPPSGRGSTPAGSIDVVLVRHDRVFASAKAREILGLRLAVGGL